MRSHLWVSRLGETKSFCHKRRKIVGFGSSKKFGTRKVKTLFRIKDINPHPSCKIYEGVCSCNETYIGETKRNVEVRWCEHNNPKHQSEPAKHIKDNIEHQFIWKILCDAPDFYQTRKTLESFFIRTKRPTLNDQLENQLLLFRNGIT